MKHVFLLVLMSVFTTSVVGQEAPKEYKNEFGLDGTGFIRSFLTFNVESVMSANYDPIYYLTYRRKFQPGNIRFAIGGGYEQMNFPGPQSDSLMFARNSYSIDLRIGWEFTNELSSRWQVFYGLDFRTSFAHSYNEAHYYSGGYANGRESYHQILGIAPLLGFRFRITDRISLLTEASFSLNWTKSEHREFFTPVNSTYPEIPDEKDPTVNSVYTSFRQPLSIFIVFDI